MYYLYITLHRFGIPQPRPSSSFASDILISSSCLTTPSSADVASLESSSPPLRSYSNLTRDRCWAKALPCSTAIDNSSSVG